MASAGGGSGSRKERASSETGLESHGSGPGASTRSSLVRRQSGAVCGLNGVCDRQGGWRRRAGAGGFVVGILPR
eukprot:14549324-Heterocapsa_arctica.AAC.1